MSYGEAFAAFVAEYMRANKMTRPDGSLSLGKISGRILGELADEFRQKHEATLSKKKRSKRQVKSSGDAAIIPPPEEMARAHYLAKGYTFGFEKWVGHYTANGWMVGKVKMKNWCAAMVTWQGDQPKRPPPGGPTPAQPAGIPEPAPGWRQKIEGHEDLGWAHNRDWETLPQSIQRAIVRFCA